MGKWLGVPWGHFPPPSPAGMDLRTRLCSLGMSGQRSLALGRRLASFQRLGRAGEELQKQLRLPLSATGPVRILHIRGNRVGSGGCLRKRLGIFSSRCSASSKYPRDSLAFHLHLPPLRAAHILFLLLIVLDSDNASPLASGRRTG